MAITLEATYSKQPSLLGDSSHQDNLPIRTEPGDIKQVETESARG